jgi:uncharacterized membrane protein
MMLLIPGLILFFGVHSISLLSATMRDRWVAAIGLNAWRALYSVISLAGFALLVVGYAQARRTPEVLYIPPVWMRHVVFALMLPVFPMLFAAFLPGKIRQKLKHPMLAAVKLWAFAHLLANGMLADVLLFGGFLLWAVLVRISLKRRVQRPVMPLPAASSLNDAVAIALGLSFYAMTLFWLHRVVIGVPLG